MYATWRVQPVTTTMWATTERGARIHPYQPTTLCRLPYADDHNTVIFADAPGTTSLTPAAGGAVLELRTDATGRLRQHHLTGATIFGASSHGELRTLAVILDAVNDTHQKTGDHTQHVWGVVDAAMDFQIVRKLARQPLHKATDSSLGTQALYLWAALWRLPRQVVLHLVKQESHRYSLGNGHIDLHTHNQLAEHMPDSEDPPLQDHMHTHLQHLPPIPHPGEPPALVPDDRSYNDTGRAYHYPQPIRTMAHIRGSKVDNALMNHLQHKLQTALYFSALDPSIMPVHLQTRRAQLLPEQLPLLDRVARWYGRRGIDIHPEFTICQETKDFLDTLSLAYRRLSLLAPTIIIGDLNAAPTDDDRTGPPTATNTAVWDAMHQLALTDLTAGLTGTPSHYPHQASTHPSRIDTCYGDPTTVRVHEAAYGDLPPTGTGHRPLYNDLIIPNLPPPAATLPDDTLPPTLQFPAEDDHGAWHRYNRALHAILRRPDARTLTTAMRRAA